MDDLGVPLFLETLNSCATIGARSFQAKQHLVHKIDMIVSALEGDFSAGTSTNP